jgi:hypothetical protein
MRRQLPAGAYGHPGPSTRVLRARVRVNRWSVAWAERRCSVASAAIAGPVRRANRARTMAAASGRAPPVKSDGADPAAKAISRQRQMSAMSVSLLLTRVARLLSTRALTSSANGKVAWSMSPLSRRSSSVAITGGRRLGSEVRPARDTEPGGELAGSIRSLRARLTAGVGDEAVVGQAEPTAIGGHHGEGGPGAVRETERSRRVGLRWAFYGP